MRLFFMSCGLFWLATQPIFSQDCHLALHGTVYEGDTKAGLPFATVSIPSMGKGSVADEHGHYAISDLCENTEYTIDVSHIECSHKSITIKITENTLVDFHLDHASDTLKQVQITARAVALQSAESQNTIGSNALDHGQSKGLATAIERIPGVFTLSSGQNTAKPIIQGMAGNRVAIVQQGVVIEGQQWGADHAPEVDAFSADQIQVIKGAAGVRYGVGALGGAVVLKDALFTEGAGIHGWAHSGVQSNGRLGWLAVSTDYRPFDQSHWAFRLQGSTKYGGNQRTPNYFLENTGLREQNLRFSAEHRGQKNIWNVQGSVFHQKFGILKASHTGNLTDLQNAIAANVPINNRDIFSYRFGKPYQDIDHYLAKIDHKREISPKWSWENLISWQYDIRKEYDVLRAGATTNTNKPALSFYNYTTVAESNFKHKPIRHWSGDFGSQGTWQYNQTGTGGYVPDQLTWAGAVYAIEHFKRGTDPLEYEAGIRYDYRHTHVTDTFGSARYLDTSLVFGNFSGNLGLIYSPNEYAKLRFNSAVAWRPPSMIELYARGVHHGAASYEQGTSGLSSEKAWNNGIDFSWTTSRLFAQCAAYANLLNGYIYLQPEDETILTIRGAYPLYTYQQTNAIMLGADAQLGLRFISKWGITADASTIRGYKRNVEKVDAWLPLLPPDRLRLNLIFDGAGDYWHTTTVSAFNLRIGYSFTAHQSRVPNTLTLLDAPPSYALWNAELGWNKQLKQNRSLYISLSGDNLANTAYRSYLDFFRFFADETGRAINIRTKYKF